MKEQPKRIIVIGAGYAGLLATVRLAGKTRRQNVEITLVNATEYFVERLRLHQYAANQNFKQRSISRTLHGTRVEFMQGSVMGIELARREIVVQTAYETQHLPYDNLVYALGSTIERQSVPGVKDYAYTLTPFGALSAEALREALPTLNKTGGRVLICGGGTTGVEASAEFAEAYPNLRVTLVTRGEFGMFLGRPVADYMRKSLNQLGVTVQDHTTVTQVYADHAAISGSENIPFDLCLWTGGFTVPTLAKEAGLKVNEVGQILIDPFMRSVSHPEIYAIGDSAHPVEEPGAPVRMSAFTATILGAHGADCLAAAIRGQTPKPLSFAYAGQGIALGRHNAIGFGNSPVDIPKAPYFTGRVGLAIREFFFNLLPALPSIERRIPGFVNWFGKGRYAAAKRTAHVEPVQQSI